MKTIESFLDKFNNILAEHGEMFISSGDLEADFDSIIGIIKARGYWAGVKLRFYFDKDLNLVRTEERVFGK